MLTRYLNHKQQTQGDRMCAEIAAKLFIIWGEVLVTPLMGVRALKLFTEIKQPPEKLVILFSVSVSILLTKSGFFVSISKTNS